MKKTLTWQRLQMPVILLLSVSAVILFSQSSFFQWAFPSLSISGLFTSQEEEQVYDLSTLTMPVQILVNGQYGRYCYPNSTTEDSAYLRFLPLLQEAVGSLTQEQSVSLADFREALLSPGVYFDFMNDYSAALFPQLYHLGERSLLPTLRHMVLSPASGGEYCWLYTADTQDNYRRYAAPVTRQALTEAMESDFTGGAAFAFEYGESLYPFTLYPEDLSLCPLLTASDPLTDSGVEDLLSLLSFSSSSNAHYTESSGTEVYVEETNYLRLYPGGTVSYQGTDPVSALLSIPSAAQPTQAEAVAAAWNLANHLSKSLTISTGLYLWQAEAQGDGYRITFRYQVGGIPVQLHQDAFALQIITAGNHITDFTFHCRNYSVTDQNSLLLPVQQAMAAMNSAGELFIGYADTGSESIAAQWLLS